MGTVHTYGANSNESGIFGVRLPDTITDMAEKHGIPIIFHPAAVPEDHSRRINKSLLSFTWI